MLFIMLSIHLIQRGRSQLPKFCAFVSQAFIERRSIDVTDSFEHSATVILGIELRKCGYLAGEQMMKVLLGDSEVHRVISIDSTKVIALSDSGVWNSNWSMSV